MHYKKNVRLTMLALNACVSILFTLLYQFLLKFFSNSRWKMINPKLELPFVLYTIGFDCARCNVCQPKGELLMTEHFKLGCH